MQNLLLVNLMRMGDILQTTPLIQGVRETLPGARISMVVNEAFAEVAQRIDVDAFFPFPVRSLVEALSDGGDGLVQAYACLKESVRAVEAHGVYDFVFNLTPSRSASHFASLIPHEAHRGTWVTEDGSFQAGDPWAAYLVAMTARRRTNPFHLVDIWLRSLGQQGRRGLRMALSAEDVGRAATLLTECGTDPGKDLLLGFQVSASQKEKCWSEKEFIRLGQALHQGLRARVLLFGTAVEEALCHRIRTHIPGAVNLAGKTGLGELAGALRHCRALITNDTGTQHVATAVGTPVVVVSVGPVFFRETGPYGEGHLVFQANVPCAPCSFHVSCLNPVCKERVPAQIVYKALVRLLRGEDGVPAGLPKDVSCYRSGFDERGFLEFSNPSPTPEDEKIRTYGRFWHALLDGSPQPGRAGRGARETLDPETSAGWFRLAELLIRSSRLIDRIRETGNPASRAPARLKVLNENLRTTEQQMRQVGLETEDLAPLVHYLILRREALSIEDPFRFLQETSSLYSGAAEEILERFECPETKKEARSHG